MIKNLFAVFAVFAALVAFTPKPCKAEEPTYYLTMQAYTKHQKSTQVNGKAWNEDNKGLGLEMRLNRNWTLGTGVYNNSYFDETRYAGIRYSPDALQWFEGRLAVGVTLAAATGYKTPIVGGLSVTVPYFTALIAPKGGADTSAFVSVAVAIPL